MDPRIIIDALLDAADSLTEGRTKVEELPDSQQQMLALAKLRERLKTHYYRRIPVRGDGNSFFRSVSYCFYRTEAYHMFFREASVATMERFPQIYNEAGLTTAQYETYLRRCATFREPDDPSLRQACVDTFKMRIVVLRDSGSSAVEEMVPRSGESYFVIHMCTIHGHVDAMIPTADAHPYAIVNPEVTPRIMDLMRSRYADYEDDSSDESDYIR